MVDLLITYLDSKDLGLVSYLDVSNWQIITSENLISDHSANLVLIPSRTDLVPYGLALDRYISSNSLDMPDGVKPSPWLSSIGMYDDFRAFYNDLIRVELVKWYESNKNSRGDNNG